MTKKQIAKLEALCEKYMSIRTFGMPTVSELYTMNDEDDVIFMMEGWIARKELDKKRGK
jgi:hypothetical protein